MIHCQSCITDINRIHAKIINHIIATITISLSLTLLGLPVDTMNSSSFVRSCKNDHYFHLLYVRPSSIRVAADQRDVRCNWTWILWSSNRDLVSLSTVLKVLVQGFRSVPLGVLLQRDMNERTRPSDWMDLAAATTHPEASRTIQRNEHGNAHEKSSTNRENESNVASYNSRRTGGGEVGE